MKVTKRKQTIDQNLKSLGKMNYYSLNYEIEKFETSRDFVVPWQTSMNLKSPSKPKKPWTRSSRACNHYF